MASVGQLMVLKLTRYTRTGSKTQLNQRALYRLSNTRIVCKRNTKEGKKHAHILPERSFGVVVIHAQHRYDVEISDRVTTMRWVHTAQHMQKYPTDVKS